MVLRLAARRAPGDPLQMALTKLQDVKKQSFYKIRTLKKTLSSEKSLISTHLFKFNSILLVTLVNNLGAER